MQVRWHSSSSLLLVLACAIALFVACGSSEDKPSGFDNNGDGNDAGNADNGDGGDTFGGEGGVVGHKLVVTPPTATITINDKATPATQAFTATLDGTPVTGPITWTLDTYAQGSIASTGVFTTT